MNVCAGGVPQSYTLCTVIWLHKSLTPPTTHLYLGLRGTLIIVSLWVILKDADKIDFKSTNPAVNSVFRLLS